MAALCRSLCQRTRSSSSSSLLMSRSSLKSGNPIANRAGAHAGIPTKFSDYITQVRAISSIRLTKISPIFLHQNTAFRYYCMPICRPKPKEQYFNDDEIRKMLIKTFSAGFELCSKDSCLPAGKRFLCLQFVFNAKLDDIRRVIQCISQRKLVKKDGLNNPTYQLPVEGAVGILDHFQASWVHGYSILIDKLGDWHNKLQSPHFRGMRKAKCDEEEAIHIEVTLFVVVDKDFESKHKQITGCGQLENFLKYLKEKNIADVHLTYSGVRLVAAKEKKED